MRACVRGSVYLCALVCVPVRVYVYVGGVGGICLYPCLGIIGSTWMILF
jgi:hypothetical protein